MRLFLLSVIFFVGTAFLIKAQDTTRVVQRDTVDNVVQITPYFSQNLRTSANYVKKIDDPDLLRFSSGVSIFNALRGQVLGISVPSYFNQATASGIRTGPYPFTNEAIVIIDGITFNNYIGGYLNLNAFDFTSVSTFSNTNALNFLGGVNSGAFVLTSKTGESITEPRIEFNAYATYGWDEVINPQAGQTDKNGEWFLANAIAYSRDFGAIDARISYTNQKQFFQSYAEPYIHNLKVNTGLVANDKLDIHLIADGRYSRFSDTSSGMGRPGATDTDVTSSDYFVNGNLVARYQLTPWLAATSQVVLTRHGTNTKKTGPDWGWDSEENNSRDQANVFLNVSKEIGSKLNVLGFTGFQYARQNIDEFYSQYGPPTGEAENQINLEENSRAVLAQASVNYSGLLFLSAHYKSAKHSNWVDDKSDANAYSVSSSFIFTELMGKSFLSFGKIRASIGEHTVVPFSSYPVLNYYIFTFPVNKQNQYQVNNAETGLDFGFINSRLLVTVNYFENRENYNLPGNLINGVDQYLNKGWETEIRYRSVEKPKLSFESGLALSNSKSKFDQKNSEGEYSKPFLRAGWFNQLKFKSIIVTMLIESVNNFTGYDSNTGFVESSFTKLRDVSFGFQLPVAFSGKATLSVSGRNLVKFGGSGIDLEERSGVSVFQKSMSINLNVIF